jgi:hypothetical protein
MLKERLAHPYRPPRQAASLTLGPTTLTTSARLPSTYERGGEGAQGEGAASATTPQQAR